jgi:hypothetical protein
VDGDGPKVQSDEPVKRSASSWQAWALRLLLAAVAAVILVRAGRFTTRGVVLDSHDETTWLGWAWRDPGVAELWGRVAERLAPGERVVLLLPADADPVWAGVMAVYHLSGQELVEVRQGRIDRPLPPAATVVRLRRDGTVRIRRPGAAP